MNCKIERKEKKKYQIEHERKSVIKYLKCERIVFISQRMRKNGEFMQKI